MTGPNREIQAAAEHNYARWRHCFVAAFFVATLAVTADAQPLTFNDPTVTMFDVFGRSVAIDGNNVLIGAPEDDTLGPDVGQAHLFDAVTGNLVQTFNDPTVTTGDQFGQSVALDGNYVLIGASGDGTLGPKVGSSPSVRRVDRQPAANLQRPLRHNGR